VTPRRGGLRPTPDDHHALRHGSPQTGTLRSRVRSSASPPAGVDLRHLVHEVLDQGQTNSCGGQAVAQAVRLSARANGAENPPLPSRRYLYHDAVGYGHAHRAEAFADLGTTFGDIFSATAWVGVVDEVEWPWNEERVLEQPPLRLFRHGSDYRWSVDGFLRFEDGERSLGLRHALDAMYPTVIGLSIDEAFEAMDGPSVITKMGAPIGGHALAAVGYDPEGLWIVNSWGRGWRNAGFAKIAWSVIESPVLMDAWAVSIAPPRVV